MTSLSLEIELVPHPDGPAMAKVDADELVKIVLEQDYVQSVEGTYQP